MVRILRAELCALLRGFAATKTRSHRQASFDFTFSVKKKTMALTGQKHCEIPDQGMLGPQPLSPACQLVIELDSIACNLLRT